MQSLPFKPYLKQSALLLLFACCAGCVSTPVTRDVPSCSALIPSDWKNGVPGAPLPTEDGKEAWREFGLKQTGQLSTANGRTRDTIAIVSGCEARDRQANAPRRWWQFWR